MPSLTPDFLNQLRNVTISDYSNFIETGTYMGATIFAMEKYFTKLYTIEIKNEFYKRCKAKYVGSKINFMLGDSTAMLKNVIENVTGPAVFFLDGHWSAGNTGKGMKDCPLFEEMVQIVNEFKFKAIIIIDDYRLFGTHDICDWKDINKNTILEIVKNRVSDTYHLPSSLAIDDRLIIHLNEVV